MAKIHTLTYNGTKSSDLGVFVTGSGSFDAAEIDVDKYEIPGRNGNIILTNHRYKNIEITYPAFIPKAFMDKVQNVRNWLRSSRVYARLEDTYDMDHYRLGIPTGVQSFSPENRNDGANFEMTFDCKPQRFLKVGETPETVEADVQTESGEIVTFETVAESPITSASVSLSPIQSGSGDPSPTNIRPISGHTGAELIRTGKNLLPHKFYQYSSLQLNVGTDTSTTYAHYLKAGTYTLSASLMGQARWLIREEHDTANTNVGGTLISANPHGTFTIDKDGMYRIWLYGSGITAEMVTWFQLELGSSATTYEPYQGDTYSVTFTDQGTVYGGTYDFVSGKLTVTHTVLTLTGSSADENWAFQSGNNYYQFTQYVDQSRYGNATAPLSDSFQTMPLSDRGAKNGVVAYNDSGYRFCVLPDFGVTTLAEWKTWLSTHNVQLYVPLATPLEYTLSPQQLTTLLGQNVVWGSGPITLTYAEPYNIENPTMFDARPLFTVTNPAEGDVIMVNGQAITFVDGYTGTVFIDCETMNAYSGAANLNSIIQATDFPVLVPGTNIVTWTGAGECTMTPRWWEL